MGVERAGGFRYDYFKKTSIKLKCCVEIAISILPTDDY